MEKKKSRLSSVSILYLCPENTGFAGLSRIGIHITRELDVLSKNGNRNSAQREKYEVQKDFTEFIFVIIRKKW